MTEPEPQPRRKLAWWYVDERDVTIGLIGFAIGAAIMVLILTLAG